jgi:hypothetical protein
MKKPIALFLCLMLTLPALAEELQTFTFPIEKNESGWVQVFPLKGGMLCRIDGGRKYFYLNPEGTELIPLKVEEPDPQSLEEGSDNLRFLDLVEDEGKSYALIETRSKMFAVPIDLLSDTLSFSNAVELDYDHRIRYYEPSTEEEQRIFLETGDCFVLVGDTLYVTYSGPSDAMELDSFNVLSGEYSPCMLEGLVNIAPYKNGKMLIVQVEGGSLYTQGATFIASILNPEDLEIEEFAKLGDHFDPYPGSKVFYEEKSDNLLYINNMQIYRLKRDGSEELCGYKPSKCTDLILLNCGKFAGADGHAVYLIPIDGSRLPTAHIRMYNVYDDEEVRSLMSDVMFTDVEAIRGNTIALGQALISGALETDVLSLRTSTNDPAHFIQKGYFADLQDVPGVKEYMDSLYPFLSQPFMKDGSIYAIPVQIDSNTLGYSHTVMVELGYEAPKTFQNFCDIVTDFHENHADDKSITLIDEPVSGPWFFTQMVNLYLYTRLEMGLPLVLDTPEFREMLASYESLPAVYRQADSEMNDDAWMEISERKPLFLTYTQSSPFSLTYVFNEMQMEREDTYSEFPLMISAWEGAPAIRTFYAKYLGVFTQSPNMYNAKRYIELVVQNMGNEHLSAVVKGYNEPVESEDYHASLKRTQEKIEVLKAELEKAEGTQKTQLEKELEAYQKGLELYEKYWRYTISPEGLHYYQENVMTAPVLDTAHPLLGRHSPINDLMNRYFGGQINIDQLIKEFDQKARLITLEQQ